MSKKRVKIVELKGGPMDGQTSPPLSNHVDEYRRPSVGLGVMVYKDSGEVGDFGLPVFTYRGTEEELAHVKQKDAD